MPSIHGYHGRYLRVDLSTGLTETRALDPTLLRSFIGGTGLGTALLLAEGREYADPLAPEAPLIFAFSPLVGTPLTTSAKFAVVAQSPLTMRINDSLSSSHFAIAGKKTGYDALVIVGRSERPACLVIEPSAIRLIEAGDFWGLSSHVAAERLAERLEQGFRIAAIGPAGERLIRYATVSHDGRHAGRGGHGAVMGSKQLKAIAVRGDRLTSSAHPKDLIRFSRELSRKSFGPATAKYRELGTVSNLLTFNRLGTLPTRNFQQTTFAEAEQLAPETLALTHPRTRASCAACTIGCEHIFHPRTDDGVGVRMEYENLFALGPLCGISDPDVVLQASRMCDELGIDTISAGATIAFAMECCERGLWAEADLRFGDARALLETLKQIGLREGPGELLAEGTRRAAEMIGGGSIDFAPQVKGLEIPGYDPRALQTMALGFAVGARGADHNRSGAYQVDFSEGVDRLAPGGDAVRAAIDTEHEAALMDSLILCKFLRGVFDDRLSAMGRMLRLVTGWEVDEAELTETARRLITARKWYNIRQGWTPTEDTLPRRFFTDAVPEGDSAGALLDEPSLRRQITLYNRASGWTDEGWLTAAQQQELMHLTEPKCPTPSF